MILCRRFIGWTWRWWDGYGGPGVFFRSAPLARFETKLDALLVQEKVTLRPLFSIPVNCIGLFCFFVGIKMCLSAVVSDFSGLQYPESCNKILSIFLPLRFLNLNWVMRKGLSWTMVTLMPNALHKLEIWPIVIGEWTVSKGKLNFNITVICSVGSRSVKTLDIASNGAIFVPEKKLDRSTSTSLPLIMTVKMGWLTRVNLLFWRISLQVLSTPNVVALWGQKGVPWSPSEPSFLNCEVLTAKWEMGMDSVVVGMYRQKLVLGPFDMLDFGFGMEDMSC